EVDEALLTGESDPVRRQPGDQLLSGSICVAGEGAYRAAKVGREAFAQSTSLQARRYSYSASPLTRAIDRVIQILSIVAVLLCLLYTTVYALGGYHSRLGREFTPEEMKKIADRFHKRGLPPTQVEERAIREAEERLYVRMVAATITSMVPQGLV